MSNISKLRSKLETLSNNTLYNPNQETWISKVTTNNNIQTIIQTIGDISENELWFIEAKVFAMSESDYLFNHFSSVINYNSGANINTINTMTPSINSLGAASWSSALSAVASTVNVIVNGVNGVNIDWHLELKLSRY